MNTVWVLGDQLNRAPAGQRELNRPTVDGEAIPGLQHKYAQTVLYFPAQGQTCHAYCTYCFRWAQFVGDQDLRFAASDPSGLIQYLSASHHDHPHSLFFRPHIIGRLEKVGNARIREHVRILLCFGRIELGFRQHEVEQSPHTYYRIIYADADT